MYPMLPSDSGGRERNSIGVLERNHIRVIQIVLEGGTVIDMDSQS